MTLNRFIATKILLLLTCTEQKPSATNHTDGKASKCKTLMYQYYIYQFFMKEVGLRNPKFARGTQFK